MVMINHQLDNPGMSNSYSSERLKTRLLNSTVKVLPTTATDVTSLKRKKVKQMRKTTFLQEFGKNPCVRVPDWCAYTFFQLSTELGFKNDGDTIAWLLKQAEPAVSKIIGASERTLETDERDTSISFRNAKHHKIKTEEFWRNCNVNHIWALWDDLDGMPRLYARINKLFHMEMKVEVVLLEPQPTTDEETFWLAEKNLPIACGTFTEATITTVVEFSAFSHQVNCLKGYSLRRPVYKIYPRDREIWAVFKDWDVNWTLHDLMSHTRYEIVEVIADLCEESPINVRCLTRVKGFEAAFRRRLHKGLNVHQQFSKEELLRFSHRIPVSKLKEKELDGISGVSWKLNTAAIPLHLR